ncbi:MAG: hypothetical protein VB996_15545 [Pseudomonadales bacterium]
MEQQSANPRAGACRRLPGAIFSVLFTGWKAGKDITYSTRSGQIKCAICSHNHADQYWQSSNSSHGNFSYLKHQLAHHTD